MRFRDSDRQWHRWFAWHPVLDGNRRSLDGQSGKLDYIWLEWVERRRASGYEGAGLISKWVYRIPGKPLSGSRGVTGGRE